MQKANVCADRTLAKWISVVALAAATCTLAPRAAAQDVAAAEALFREGRALLDKGDYAAACKKLAESQRLDPSSGTLLNLAQCHEKQGKTATAWAEYLAASRLAKTQGRPDRAEEAKKQAAELEPKLSTLTIIVSEKVPGLEIQRDKVKLEAGTIGSKIPTDPGPHELTISAPGYESVSMTVTVGKERDAQTVTVPALNKKETTEEPAPPTAAPPPVDSPPATPRPDTPPEADQGSPTLAYVVGGAGIAALAVGGVFGAMALSSYSDADDKCPSHQGCSQEAIDARDKAGTRANIANVGIGLGIVGVGVGAVLLLTSGPSESAKARTPKALFVQPSLAQHQVGLDLTGSF